jgi:hypothetical protein
VRCHECHSRSALNDDWPDFDLLGLFLAHRRIVRANSIQAGAFSI